MKPRAALMIPTPFAALTVAAGIPLALVLILIDVRLWPIGLLYLVFIAILMAADVILAVPSRALGLETAPPALLYVGETEAFEITLGADIRRRPAVLEVALDVGAALHEPERLAARLVPGEPLRLSIALTPKRRGMAEVHRLWLRWRGPLNLITHQRRHELALALPIQPNIRAVGSAAIRLDYLGTLLGDKPQTRSGAGSEFEAMRAYVPGLDHRAIDWKHSARHRALICKEYRAERNHQIVLAFDSGQLMCEPLGGIAKLDHAVNAGMMLAYLSLRAGDRVGLAGFDTRLRLYREPLGGVHNFWQLQHAASEFEYRHEESNFTLALSELLGRLTRRSLVILYSEFVDTITAELMIENLERLNKRHIVIFITLQDPVLNAIKNRRPGGFTDVARSVIADDMVRERRIVFERLRRLGVHGLDAPAEHIGARSIERYLMIKRQELI
jgi:uncharacterized protein (DUF58 family)